MQILTPKIKNFSGDQEIPLAVDISTFLVEIETRLEDLACLKLNNMELAELVEVLGMIVEKFGG